MAVEPLFSPKLAIQEVELLATILQRAGVNQVEAAWVNAMLNKLRLIAKEEESEPELSPETRAKLDSWELGDANSALR